MKTDLLPLFLPIGLYVRNNRTIISQVLLAGDHADAKQKVSDMVRAMGFHPVDWGNLPAARDIEDVPLRLMPSWKRPVAVVFGVFVFLWILAFFS